VHFKFLLILYQSNVVIDGEGVPRLCDFGRSRIIAHRGYTTALAGAVRWMAPELFVAPPEPEDSDTDEIPLPHSPESATSADTGVSDAPEIPLSLSDELTKKTDIYGLAMVILEVSNKVSCPSL
jgi:hypothetical protein